MTGDHVVTTVAEHATFLVVQDVAGGRLTAGRMIVEVREILTDQLKQQRWRYLMGSVGVLMIAAAAWLFRGPIGDLFTRVDPNSIAVLPFQNRGGQANPAAVNELLKQKLA